jgi:IS5 family transposase
LRILRSRLGRIIRDIGRKIAGNAALQEVFAWPLSRASQIRSQQQRQRGWKLYSFHAPEVECIGKGKASAPYEFGVKVSIVTTNARAPGGQFVLNAKDARIAVSIPGIRGRKKRPDRRPTFAIS